MQRSIRHLIGNHWSEAGAEGGTAVYNPSTGEVIGTTPAGGMEEIDQAAAAAQAALPAWSQTPPQERARLMFRYKALLDTHFEEIARGICREHGKTYAEAKGDLYRGMEVVEYACGMPALLMGDTLENVARGVDCETYLQPVGVCAGITPFNFPAMIPLWMFPIALACGNTFILKPSEKVPYTATRLVELLQEAGLPPGVLNLVHGGRETVEAILLHPHIRAVSFVGSSPVAKYIYETGTSQGKRVQANGGAKNFILIMPDADVSTTVEGITTAAFGCAGERCMAASVAVTVQGAGKTFLPELARAASALKVGPTDREGDFQMGPVISAAHRDRVEELMAQGVQQGARPLVDGRGLKVAGAEGGFYVGAGILEGVQPGMKILEEEIFGPVLSVMEMDDLDAAIEIANCSAYGNGASIFTRSGGAARKFRQRIQCGMVGVNIGVPASLAMFPFTGWGQSFYGDLHIQGREAVSFYTRQKVVTTRWKGDADVWRK